MSKLNSLMANMQPVQPQQPMQSVTPPSGSLGSQMYALSQNVGVPINSFQQQQQQQMGQIPTTMPQMQAMAQMQSQHQNVAQALLGQPQSMPYNQNGVSPAVNNGNVNILPQIPQQGVRMGSIFGAGNNGGGSLGGLF